MVNVDDFRQRIESEMQESIYSSAVEVHCGMIMNDFQKLITKHLEKRLDLMDNCGVYPTKMFYSTIRSEMIKLFEDSLEGFFAKGVK